MAGYYLHSLDWIAVDQFFNSPTGDDISRFASLLAPRLAEIQDGLEDGFVMFGWPTDANNLAAIVEAHFKLNNWYFDVSSDEGNAWESALTELVENEKQFSSKFHGDDHIYWNAISEAIGHHKSNDSPAPELNSFGRRPFHYSEPEEDEMEWFWHPMHSMHTPDETSLIAKQLLAAEKTVMNSTEVNAPEDFEVLRTVLNEIVPNNRVLYVTLDY